MEEKENIISTLIMNEHAMCNATWNYLVGKVNEGEK